VPFDFALGRLSTPLKDELLLMNKSRFKNKSRSFDSAEVRFAQDDKVVWKLSRLF